MIAIEELRSLPSLSEFPPEECSALLGASVHRSVSRGAVLWKQGVMGRSCLIVVRGALEAVRERSDGAQVVATMRPGSLVGQLALIDRTPRGATVRAAVASELLEFTRDDFERLLAATSPLALRFQLQVAVAGIRQLRSVLRRLAEIPQRTASEGPEGEVERVERISLLNIAQAASDEWSISMDELDQVEVLGVGDPAVSAQAAQNWKKR